MSAAGEANDAESTARLRQLAAVSPRTALALLLSCTSLLITFWGLHQVDLPVARFIRSLYHNHRGIPREVWNAKSWELSAIIDERPRDIWMARLSDFGDWLGSSEVLFTVSGVLLAIGVVWKWKQFRSAAWQSAIAHALIGLPVHALKHLIGRPRPKLTHGDGLFLLPSLEYGLDSFPSGHAAASFAVATVLAKHFPRMSWLAFSLAGLAGISRVIRASHFPTDIMAGATLGVVIGVLVSNPLGNRWLSLVHGAARVSVGFAVAFALLWIAMHSGSDGHFGQLGLPVGAVVVVTGLAIRFARIVGLPLGPRWLHSGALGNVCIGLGLALATGSTLIVALGACAIVAVWLLSRNDELSVSAETKPGSFFEGKTMAYACEVLVAVASLSGLAVIPVVKGILPLV